MFCGLELPDYKKGMVIKMEKLKIVLVGCGTVSDKWLATLLNREDVEIIGLVNRTVKKAEQKKKQFALECPVFSDYKEAITTLTPDIVVDTTPPEVHFALDTFALELGCHVLCEKPVSMSIKEVENLRKTVKETGRRVIVLQNRRYLNQIVTLKKILDDGLIGKVGAIYSDFFKEAHFGGFRDEMEHPILLEMSIHTFDQARYLLGKNPESVYCTEYNPAYSWYKGDANTSCIFDMEDGIKYHYNASWCVTGKVTSWESEWRITGSKGTAFWDGTNSPYYEVLDESYKDDNFPTHYIRREIPSVKIMEDHEGCIVEMIDCLKSGKVASTELADNYYSLMMVMKSIESSEAEKKVRF